MRDLNFCNDNRVVFETARGGGKLKLAGNPHACHVDLEWLVALRGDNIKIKRGWELFHMIKQF